LLGVKSPDQRSDFMYPTCATIRLRQHLVKRDINHA